MVINQGLRRRRRSITGRWAKHDMKKKHKLTRFGALIAFLVLAIVLGFWLNRPKTFRVIYDQFEQDYIKSVEMVIRPTGAGAAEILFLFTVDKDTYYTWRNWPIGKSDEHPGGLIFPEAFILKLYDDDGFDIATLRISSSSLENWGDELVGPSNIVLGATQSPNLTFKKIQKTETLRFTFRYEVK